ncbi:MAG: DUF2125 domain-containing protein [Rhizomicrobium sp.]|jgi:hypothetical protein
MRYSSRFFLYAPFLMFVSLAGAVMIYWWIAATALDKQLDADNGREIVPGVKLTFAAKKIAGFPFRLDTILDGLKIEIATTQGPLIWRTEHFASHALNYGRDQSVYEAAGRQEVSWRDDDGVQHDFVFVPGWLRASSIAAKGMLTRFDLDIVEIASPDLGAGRIQLHMRRDPASDALDIAASGDTIRLAPDLQAGFGDTISHLLLAGKLVPGHPFASLLAGRSDWRRATDDWRVHGGVLSVDQFDIKWNKLAAKCRGSLVLDPSHRLNGTITLDMSGGENLNANATGKLAHALANLAARNAADGTLAASLTFKQGFALAGDQPAGYLGPLY